MTDVFECKEKGFHSVLKTEAWQIATVTYDAGYSKEGFTYMKRHLKTDEAFCLVEGSAVLHTAEDGILKDFEVKRGHIYHVHKNTWHYLEISPDARLVLIENRDVFPEDSERMELTCLLQKS